MVGDGVHDALFVVACVFAGASAGAGVPIIVPTELVVCVVGKSESVGSVTDGSTPSGTGSWRTAMSSTLSAPATAFFHLRRRWWCEPKIWRFAGAEKVVACPCGAAGLRRWRLLSSSSSSSPESA